MCCSCFVCCQSFISCVFGSQDLFVLKSIVFIYQPLVLKIFSVDSCVGFVSCFLSFSVSLFSFSDASEFCLIMLIYLCVLSVCLINGCCIFLINRFVVALCRLVVFVYFSVVIFDLIVVFVAFCNRSVRLLRSDTF